jgi:hypothetical protein
VLSFAGYVPPAGYVYTGGGAVRKISYIVTPYTAVIDRRWTARRRGRPFDLPVGRRRSPAR